MGSNQSVVNKLLSKVRSLTNRELNKLEYALYDEFEKINRYLAAPILKKYSNCRRGTVSKEFKEFCISRLWNILERVSKNRLSSNEHMEELTEDLWFLSEILRPSTPADFIVASELLQDKMINLIDYTSANTSPLIMCEIIMRACKSCGIKKSWVLPPELFKANKRTCDKTNKILFKTANEALSSNIRKLGSFYYVRVGDKDFYDSCVSTLLIYLYINDSIPKEILYSLMVTAVKKSRVKHVEVETFLELMEG